MVAASVGVTRSDAFWQREAPVNSARSARLTAVQVARTAIAVADNENLAGVSVKRVAGRLRVPAARLEHYLRSRDELHDLMLDVVLGDIELPDHEPGTDWRVILEALARRTMAAAEEHPWLVEVIGGRAPSGPAGLRYVEHALTALAPTGLDSRNAALCFNALLSFVCGSVRVRTRTRLTRRDESGSAERGRADARYLASAVADGAHPRLAELFDDAADLGSEESFTVGLACLLDGIAARAGDSREVTQSAAEPARAADR